MSRGCEILEQSQSEPQLNIVFFCDLLRRPSLAQLRVGLFTRNLSQDPASGHLTNVTLFSEVVERLTAIGNW